jgi:DNA-binding transcriptional regulator YhcF (GntR family)
MAWELKNDRPIYTQLLEQIEQKIVTGEYELGGRLPSVRELAAEASVNPNTMQRAMTELEQRGLIVTNRTSGRCVTEDASVLNEIRESRAMEYTKQYIDRMTELKFGEEEMINLIRKGDSK